jgi:hypothetical protein
VNRNTVRSAAEGGIFMQKMIIAVVAICAIAGVAITAVSVPLER